MRTSQPFVLGTIMGGVAVWFRGTELEGYVVEEARRARAQGADAMRAVEDQTGELLDSSGVSLRRAEGVLPDTGERTAGHAANPPRTDHPRSMTGGI